MLAIYLIMMEIRFIESYTPPIREVMLGTKYKW